MAPFMVDQDLPDQTCDSLDLTGPLYRCTFRKQTLFTAIQNVERLRDAPCWRKEAPPVRSVWDVRAPDFAVKHYAPPIKRPPPPPHPPPPRAVSQPINSSDGTVRERMERASPESRSCHNLIGLAKMADTSTKEKDFILHFRVPTPNTARRMAVRNSGHPVGPYLDPKPHDHRGLPPIKSLGLPEIVLSKEPDPFNIRFKNENLDIFFNSNQVQLERRKTDVKTQWTTRKTPELMWDKSLTLPKECFRKRYAAFTRHRRLDRTVHSALMDRTEEDFVKRVHSRQTVN